MHARSLRVLPAVVAVGALITGCGGDSDSAPKERSAPATDAASTPAPSALAPPPPPPTTGATTVAPTTGAPTNPPTTPGTAAPLPPSRPLPRPSPPAGPVAVTDTVLATDLEVPWGLAFLPDGTALVSERKKGRVVSISPGGDVAEVARLPSRDRGEGGLLGLAVSPDYGADRFVYAYFTGDQDNRVVRFRLGGPIEPVLIGIPAGSNHNGGRIAFGPDGLLYVATGDAQNRAAAQDPGSLGGKILRIEPDGSVPADNPIPGNPLYSLGHRNVQGLDWTADGTLYATEFGQDTFDEVNRIEPGGNYGWPEVEGSGGAPRFIDPLTTWSTDEASPSGEVIPRASSIPQWDGDVLVAGLQGRRIWRLDLGPEGRLLGREPLYEGRWGRLRTIAQAPDGSLWVLTSNRDGRGQPTPGDDKIIRLAPA